MKQATPARRARLDAGFSSAELVAKLLRCSAEKVRLAERPGGVVTLNTALRLARLYGCSANLFIYASGPRDARMGGGPKT